MPDKKPAEPPTDYQKQAEEYLCGWQRAKADYANLIKRTEAERGEVFQFACMDVVMKLIPVLDNFRHAITALPKELEKNEWAQGVIYIRKQLEQIITEMGAEEYGKVGDKFDPMFHEAVEDLCKAEAGEKIVKEVVCTGYKLGGKVIRVAKVKVSN